MFRSVFPNGRMKALTLSYDDGVSSDIRLTDIMKKHGIKGTFNLNGGMMHGEGSMRGKEYVYRLKPDEVREVYRGMEIAVHGYTHPFFEQLPRGIAVDEVMKDREALEALAGYPVCGMAYPYGTYDDSVVKMLAELGIVYSRTTVSTLEFNLPTNFLTWHATCHHANPKLPELCERFCEPVTKYTRRKLFYLWGHSYEFAQNDNWEIIEQFCEKMGGKEDVWYATNMEIYRYLTAQKRIISSVNGKMLYNPTDVDVWFLEDAKVMEGAKAAFCVPAGKQINL